MPQDIATGTSTWITRQGSILVLDRARDGLLQGYFVNNAPGKGCRGIPYGLKGQIVEDTIVFDVSWYNGVADCPMNTQWRGRVQPSPAGRLEILAEWQLSSTVMSIGVDGEETQRGVDVFTLQMATSDLASTP